MLLDTSGLLSLLWTREPHHALALELYSKKQPNVTHNLILAELVALGHVRGVPRARILATIDDLLAAPATEVIWVDPTLNARAIVLLRARLDKGYSLADAVSFVIMRDRGLQEALTTDHHFDQEGFIRLLG
jgi:uncharacterized protein